MNRNEDKWNYSAGDLTGIWKPAAYVLKDGDKRDIYFGYHATFIAEGENIRPAFTRGEAEQILSDQKRQWRWDGNKLVHFKLTDTPVVETTLIPIMVNNNGALLLLYMVHGNWRILRRRK